VDARQAARFDFVDADSDECAGRENQAEKSKGISKAGCGPRCDGDACQLRLRAWRDRRSDPGHQANR
jgi:hypothetical protein